VARRYAGAAAHSKTMMTRMITIMMIRMTQTKTRLRQKKRSNKKMVIKRKK